MKLSIFLIIFLSLAKSSVADLFCPPEEGASSSDYVICDAQLMDIKFAESTNEILTAFDKIIALETAKKIDWSVYKSKFLTYIDITNKQIEFECNTKIYLPFNYGSGAGVDFKHCVITSKKRVIREVLKEHLINLNNIIKYEYNSK
jgi:hypothetical protein